MKNIGTMVKVGAMAAMMAMAGSSPAFACDPVTFHPCSCPAGCDQDYCEYGCELTGIILDRETEEIRACLRHCTRCQCGGIACEPKTGGLKGLAGLLLAASTVRAEDGKAVSSAGESKVIRNAHGEFRLEKPSAREQENAGVGVQVAMKGDDLVVMAVGEGSPAEKASLKEGDVVVSVDGRSMRGVGLKDAVVAMRGKPGTLVVLGVKAETEKTGVRKVPLIRQHLVFRKKGEAQPVIGMRSFEKPEKAEKCAAERDGCLFLLEEQGRCHYSCKTETEPAKGK